jgi:hypothetical protein
MPRLFLPSILLLLPCSALFVFRFLS